MADLKVRIIADLKKLKNDIKGAITQEIDVGIKGGKGGGKGEGKGIGDILGSLGVIAKILAPVAILLSLKPVADLLKLLNSFLTFALLKLLKFFGVFGEDNKDIVEAIQQVNFNLDKLKEDLDFKQGILDMTQALADSGITIGDSLDTSIGDLRSILQSQGFNIEDLTNEMIREIAEGVAIQNIVRKENEDLTKSIVAAVEEGTLSQEDADKLLEDNIQEIPEAIKGQAKEVAEAIETSGKEIIDKANEDIRLSEQMLTFLGLVAAFKPILDKIAAGINKLIDRIKGFFSGLFRSKEKSVGDAIIRPDGTIIRTDPRDTLIATKNPEGIGGSKTINLFGVTNVEMIEIIKRELGVEVNASGRF